MNAPVFEMRHIRKAFPGVVALDDVSFDCQEGEVHALVGENGAGKSTLMKILSGAYEADSGSITIDGRAVRFSHPVEALRAGISVIHQEFALLPDRSVSENIFLGHEPTHYGMLDSKRMDQETQAVLELFSGSHKIDPSSVIGELSVAEQQMVEIAKSVALGAKIVVMDEPTAALNELECEVLFDLVDNLRGRGKAIVYITHRMREIDRLADRVTVLKDGQVTATFDSVPPTSDIIRAMVGRDIEDFFPPPAKSDGVGQVILAVNGGSNDQLNDLNLELRAGEIVDFAGLQGAGRTAFAKALYGDEPFQSGNITIRGVGVVLKQPRDA
ncbi:MAG: sugar ABC transporter ATP-binding protein, partial [Hyphomicrobiaceae bacterium]